MLVSTVSKYFNVTWSATVQQCQTPLCSASSERCVYTMFAIRASACVLQCKMHTVYGLKIVIQYIEVWNGLLGVSKVLPVTKENRKLQAIVTNVLQAV